MRLVMVALLLEKINAFLAIFVIIIIVEIVTPVMGIV
jgi:hypothetical protein